jgi:hypothetical protein
MGKGQSHATTVGIIRLPGRGWPVKCQICGRIGFGVTQEAARKLAASHTRSKR